MYYRETGQAVKSYAEDRRMIPVREDRWVMWMFVAVMFIGVPLFANDYWLSAILIPMMVLGVATLGLNIASGYTGQLSLGTAGFMCFGAFTAYNLMFRLPWMNLWLAFLCAGIVAGLVGIIFGLPSLRIKGFYLLVSTLCAQFFAEWFFNAYPWFLNYTSSGVVHLPTFHYRFLPFQDQIFDLFGLEKDYNAYVWRYLITLIVVIVLSLASEKHGAQFYWAKLDGSAGYGHRCKSYRYISGQNKIKCVFCKLFLLRGCRCDVFILLYR